jgi:hypothetical protein
MLSSNGKDKLAPSPRKTVRRESFFLVIIITLFSAFEMAHSLQRQG